MRMSPEEINVAFLNQTEWEIVIDFEMDLFQEMWKYDVLSLLSTGREDFYVEIHGKSWKSIYMTRTLYIYQAYQAEKERYT